MSNSNISINDFPDWVKEIVPNRNFVIGEKLYFFDCILNKGVLCKVKNGNEWVNDIPVKIKGLFITRNDFAYIADSRDIPKEFPALCGSNTFTDAIPVYA